MFYVWVCKIAQLVGNDSSCSKPYDLNLVPETHMMEENNCSTWGSLMSTHMHLHPPDKYIHKRHMHLKIDEISYLYFDIIKYFTLRKVANRILLHEILSLVFF